MRKTMLAHGPPTETRQRNLATSIGVDNGSGGTTRSAMMKEQAPCASAVVGGGSAQISNQGHATV